MKIKFIYTIMLAASLMLVTNGCQDYLDINDDPTNPTEVVNTLVIPAAQASVAIIVGGTFTNHAGFFAQYWTQAPEASQYQVIDTYVFKSDDIDREWQELYSGGLNDFEQVARVAEEGEEWGEYLMARAMQAYTFQLLVDLHDRIPFSEALQGTDFLSPAWDDGQAVYNGLIEMIDDGLGREGLAGSSLPTSDLLFGSDLDQLIGFANTLKLKIYLRQAYVAGSNVGPMVQALLTQGQFITADIGLTNFEPAAPNRRNPWFDTNVDRLGGVNHIATHTMVTFLRTNSDPRLEAMYTEAANGGWEGNYPGTARDSDNTKSENTDDFSFPNIVGDTPAYIMTYAESQFLIAEAHARYTGNDAAARAAYEEGVRASFGMHGLSGSEVPLLAAGGDYEWTPLTGDVEADIEQIMVQKWVANALFMQIEGWLDFIRTDYPRVSAVPGADAAYVPGEILDPIENRLGAGNFPNRMLYPDVEVSRNANTPDQVQPTAKVWWDQK